MAKFWSEDFGKIDEEIIIVIIFRQILLSASFCALMASWQFQASKGSRGPPLLGLSPPASAARSSGRAAKRNLVHSKSTHSYRLVPPSHAYSVVTPFSLAMKRGLPNKLHYQKVRLTRNGK